jgi:hypothetical protein
MCSIQLIFLPKRCHVDLALICHFLLWDPHLKAMCPIYDSHPIRLLYFVGPKTLDCHLKWSLVTRGTPMSRDSVASPLHATITLFGILVMLLDTRSVFG